MAAMKKRPSGGNISKKRSMIEEKHFLLELLMA